MKTWEMLAVTGMAGALISATWLMRHELNQWRRLARGFRESQDQWRGMFENVAEEHARFVMAVFEHDPDFVLSYDGVTTHPVTLEELKERDAPVLPWLNRFEI